MKHKKNNPSKPTVQYAPTSTEEMYQKLLEKKNKTVIKKLTPDGKVLAVIGILTFLAAIFAIPGVVDRFSRENNQRYRLPPRSNPEPPSTVRPARPEYIPLPNTPMSVDKFNQLYSQSYPSFKDIKIPKLDFHYVVVFPAATAQQHLISTGNLYASLSQESIESGGVPVSIWLSIDLTGNVTDVTPVDKTTTLSPQVISAVKQWRYRPFVYKGDTVFARTIVTLKLDHVETPPKPKQ